MLCTGPEEDFGESCESPEGDLLKFLLCWRLSAGRGEAELAPRPVPTLDPLRGVSAEECCAAAAWCALAARGVTWLCVKVVISLAEECECAYVWLRLTCPCGEAADSDWGEWVASYETKPCRESEELE